MYPEYCKFKKSIRILESSNFSPISILPIPGENSFQLPFIRKGKGPYLYDHDENRYVDFHLGGGLLLLGHAHPGITKVVKGWLGRGYSQGYPNASSRLLAASLRGFFSVGQATPLQDDGRWCFFDSGYEASASLLSILERIGSPWRGCYITCWGGKRVSALFRPYMGSILVPLSMDEVKPGGLKGYGYFILRCGRFSEKHSIGKLVNMLRDMGKPVISDESDFPSHVHFSRQLDNPFVLDARVFGSWLCGGLSFGCLICRELLFSAFLKGEKKSGRVKNHDITDNTQDDLNLLEYLYGVAGLPPLFKVKAVLRFLQLLKKSGGVERFSELNRYFFSLLDTKYFELFDGIIYLKNGVFSEERFVELRHLMLERGLFIPVSLHDPFFVSLTHDEKLLSKCAALINSITGSAGI